MGILLPDPLAPPFWMGRSTLHLEDVLLLIPHSGLIWISRAVLPRKQPLGFSTLAVTKALEKPFRHLPQYAPDSFQERRQEVHKSFDHSPYLFLSYRETTGTIPPRRRSARSPTHIWGPFSTLRRLTPSTSNFVRCPTLCQQ